MMSKNMTTREAIKYITGWSDEILDELGGFADDNKDEVEGE